jgi:hypothetical protein
VRIHLKLIQVVLLQCVGVAALPDLLCALVLSQPFWLRVVLGRRASVPRLV